MGEQLRISAEQQLRIVKLLAKGRTPVQVGEELDLPVRAVGAVSAKFGGPDRQRLEWAVDELQKAIDKASEPAPDAPPAPVVAAPAPEAPVQSSTPDDLEQLVADFDQLVQAAERSPNTTTQAKAMRLLIARDELARILSEEAAQADEAVRRAEEILAVQAEIAALQARLEELSGSGAKPAAAKPAPAGSTTQRERQDAVLARHGVGKAEVKVWAAENGHEVHPRAPWIPAAVLDAFDKAHADA